MDESTTQLQQVQLEIEEEKGRDSSVFVETQQRRVPVVPVLRVQEQKQLLERVECREEERPNFMCQVC